MPTIAPDPLHEAVLHEVLNGLLKPEGEQKTLAPWLFYDERGSQLFEDITRLPEYYLTRTERAIFEQYGPELPALLGAPQTIAELGAGSASKTGILLRTFAERQGELLYQPIDISPSALDEAATTLRAAVAGLTVRPQVANYITDTYRIARPAGHGVLALYIGSSIGNFAPDEAVGILRNLRSHLEPEDALLLGTDLAPGSGKPVETLLAAYDDAAGVTAQFNLNVLTRLSRELGARFAVNDLVEGSVDGFAAGSRPGFAHRARWNPQASRMEMHLESLRPQTVAFDGHRIHFAQGETIHTENSYKFTDGMLQDLIHASDFRVQRVFHDAARSFAVTLARAV